MIELDCEKESDKDLHIYQIEVASFQKEKEIDSEEFHQLWLKEHPGRAIRNLIQYKYETNTPFTLFHHKKEK